MLAVALLSLGSVAALYLILRSRAQPSYLVDDNGETKTRPARITGWIPWIGMGLEWSKNSNDLISKCRKAYGDVFTLFMGGQEMVVLVEPLKGIPSVYRNTKSLSFTPVIQHMMHVAFDCTQEIAKDEEIERVLHKGYVQYLTNSSCVTELTGSYLGHLEKHLRDNFSTNEPISVELWSWLDNFVFQCAVPTIFGTNLPAKEMYPSFKRFDQDFPNFTKGVPAFTMPEAVKCREILIDYLCKWHKTGHGDDASTLIKKREEYFDSRGLNSRERSTVNLGLLWGLQGNSNPATFWCLARILTTPGLLKEVRAQVATTLKEKGATDFDLAKNFDTKALIEVPILKSIFSEALRLHGSVLSIRHAKEDTTVETDTEKFLVKKGENIIVNTREVHMDPEIHENPHEFNINRFMETNMEDSQVLEGSSTTQENSLHKHTKNGKNVKHHLIPFGGGTSLCPGRFFASNEVVTTVAVITYFLDIELSEGLPATDFSRAGLGVLWSKKPLQAKISRRTVF